MRNIVSSLLIGTMVLALMPACKKNVVSEKRSYEICYRDTNAKKPELTAEKKQESAEKKAEEDKNSLPKLCAFNAKRMINADRKKKDKIINSADVKVGYYECNNVADRLTLKKLAVNDLITLSCDEIIKNGQSTYWVNVDLTSKGKKLLLKDNRFPEELLDNEMAKKELTPKFDQDEWGVPSEDYIVDSLIIIAMTQFYSGIAQGMTIDQSLLSANLQTAVRLNDALKAFESNLRRPCPFCHDMAITSDMVNQMTIKRLPRLVDAYLLTINEKGFLYVISNNNGQLLIEDVVYEDTNKSLKTDPTFSKLCSVWKEADFIKARKIKAAKDKKAAEEAERLANMQSKKKVSESEDDEDEEEDFFDMGNLYAYSVQRVKHDEPTLYEVAKQNENVQVVKLLAYKHVLKEILSIDVEKDKQTKSISAKCQVVLVKEDVSAIGRIYNNVKEGAEHRVTYTFSYYNVAKWRLD